MAALLFAVCLALSLSYWLWQAELFLFFRQPLRKHTKVCQFLWHVFPYFFFFGGGTSPAHMCVRASTNAFSYISHSLLRSHQENEKVTFLRPSLIGCTLCSSRSFSSPIPIPSPCLHGSCENNTLTFFVLAVDQHTRFIVSGMWVAGGLGGAPWWRWQLLHGSPFECVSTDGSSYSEVIEIPLISL